MSQPLVNLAKVVAVLVLATLYADVVCACTRITSVARPVNILVTLAALTPLAVPLSNFAIAFLAPRRNAANALRAHHNTVRLSRTESSAVSVTSHFVERLE